MTVEYFQLQFFSAQFITSRRRNYPNLKKFCCIFKNMVGTFFATSRVTCYPCSILILVIHLAVQFFLLTTKKTSTIMSYSSRRVVYAVQTKILKITNSENLKNSEAISEKLAVNSINSREGYINSANDFFYSCTLVLCDSKKKQLNCFRENFRVERKLLLKNFYQKSYFLELFVIV